MEHQLGRTVRVFLAILAAAGLYRLTVVPLVEPRSRAVGAGVEMSAEQEQAIRAADAARFAAFSDLFPSGAWELSAPLVFEMGKQMQLLCKDYDILPDGRVRLEQCTILVLPERRSAAGERDPGRTYVLRAPQGAILEFDAPPDLKRITSLPRLIGGSLRGQVTIRGTATAPGREDDVEILTRDIELSELEVRSNAAVEFRYGRSRGKGRGLVAVLRPRQGAAAAATPPAHPGQGPNIGGVDSIRIDRDVRMLLEGFAGGFVPGGNASAAGPDAAAAARATDAPPVLVTCRGALCLNEPAKVITLEEDVDISRDLPDRNRDHIACDLLTIYLGRDGGQGRLEPVQVIASGTPVVARSTADGLEACAATLGYDLKHARIVLSGNDPVSVKYRGNEIVARGLEYRGAAAGDIGRLDAAGYLRITDRLKDMFIVGGFNAYPAEIERMMIEHPQIGQVAVIGIPDERLGEVGAAFVVPAPGPAPEPDALIAWCREQMANYKVPRAVWLVDALPLNPSNKVLKTELRDRAAELLAGG